MKHIVILILVLSVLATCKEPLAPLVTKIVEQITQAPPDDTTKPTPPDVAPKPTEPKPVVAPKPAEPEPQLTNAAQAEWDNMCKNPEKAFMIEFCKSPKQKINWYKYSWPSILNQKINKEVRRKKAEAEAKRQAEAEAKRQAEAEAKRQAEAEVKRKAEIAEAKREAKRLAEVQRKQEEANRQAEAKAVVAPKPTPPKHLTWQEEYNKKLVESRRRKEAQEAQERAEYYREEKRRIREAHKEMRIMLEEASRIFDNEGTKKHRTESELQDKRNAYNLSITETLLKVSSYRFSKDQEKKDLFELAHKKHARVTNEYVEAQRRQDRATKKVKMARSEYRKIYVYYNGHKKIASSFYTKKMRTMLENMKRELASIL